MSDHLPNQLLTEIFLRLPLESLVCSTKSQEHFTIRNDNESFSKQFDQLEFPYKIPYGDLKVVGVCRGLVCLYLEEFSSIVGVVLWNLSIRKWRPVPIEPEPGMFVLGFGVCDVTNDHKLVKLECLEDSESNFKVAPLVKVYSLSTGSWRDVSTTAPSCYMYLEKGSQVFVFGSVHWIAYHRNGEEGITRNLVVSFHMGNEVFHELMLPDYLATESFNDLNITVLGDSLAVLKYTASTRMESCSVWVMKEYGVLKSCTKLLTFRLQQRWRTVGFRKDGQVYLPGKPSFAHRRKQYHPQKVFQISVQLEQQKRNNVKTTKRTRAIERKS
ncbi:hypothetical protein POM88_004983 [Heracleum sosnowskyi]|uniref:F-box associated beta-propeller type 1 domain-containing protein n=1 Tax=Heracleum sosnowskyi TaxID=360622 RepID=A0AAD8NEX3_9APIA|nr:hypothetical protein POM88_004983 [Heracleum sosnowskyi]